LAAHSDVIVTSAIGNNGTSSPDADYFSFYAKAGDVISLGVKNGVGGASKVDVDTVMAVYDLSSGAPKRVGISDDVMTSTGIDPNPALPDFVAPSTGYYAVAVCAFPCMPLVSSSNEADLISNLMTFGKGDYDLVVTPAAPAVKQVAILIKPGNDDLAPINPKSHGKIPVAILGSSDFNALTVDTKSLTFGSTGDENSLAKCNYQGEDVNGDGIVDLMCHFYNQKAGFKYTDAQAKLKGRTKDFEFEGTGDLKVIPDKR